MVATPPRRPGHSRRAQYGLFAAYVFALGGALIALLFALSARFDPAGHAAIQSIVTDATSPVLRAGRAVFDAAGELRGGIGAYIDAGSKNRRLEQELRAARAGLIELDTLRRDNARLKTMAGLIEANARPVVAARMIGSTGSLTRRYATFGAGSVAGVRIGQPVRAPDGLIGRVVATGRLSARVLLITDAGNVVPVKRVSDGRPALATGRGDGGMDIRSLDAGPNPFAIGDVFVTSGAGGLYHPDVPVARAVLTNREFAIARPLGDPRRLDLAYATAPFVVPADLPPPPAP